MSPSTRDSCLWLQLLFSAVCVFVCLRLLLTGSRGAALHESSSWSSPVIVAKIVTSLPLLLLQNRQILSVLLWFRLRLLCLPKKKVKLWGVLRMWISVWGVCMVSLFSDDLSWLMIGKSQDSYLETLRVFCPVNLKQRAGKEKHWNHEWGTSFHTSWALFNIELREPDTPPPLKSRELVSALCQTVAVSIFLSVSGLPSSVWTSVLAPAVCLLPPGAE